MQVAILMNEPYFKLKQSQKEKHKQEKQTITRTHMPSSIVKNLEKSVVQEEENKINKIKKEYNNNFIIFSLFD